jgi:hypothetical protein
MKKLATLAMVPLFAGFIWAQTDQQTEKTSRSETTTTKTYNGTLVDATCYKTHTEHTSTSSDADRTTTKTETSDKIECPVSTSSTAYGLLTPEGQFVRFDDQGNTTITERIKSNKEWNKTMADQKPLRVRVVATPNGDVLVLRSIE